MIRIGNASGFYGDRFAAVEEMLTGGGLDVLTGDYLAELTMLILARDRKRDPAAGYARTFLRQLENTLGLALDKRVRIVVNSRVGYPSPFSVWAFVPIRSFRLWVRYAEVGHDYVSL